MKNEFGVAPITSIFAPTTWNDKIHATIYTNDINNPWKSVYGFPVTAARLATNQKLVLHCREDEIFELIAKLNNLLTNPENLNQIYNLLKILEQATCQKMVRLLDLEKPISQNELFRLLEQVEQN